MYIYLILFLCLVVLTHYNSHSSAADGHSVIFKTEHLSTMTISEKFAKLCQDRVESVSVGESAIFASSKPGKIGKKK